MALEKKVLAGGGMDKDTDSRFLAKNDYRDAKNVRIATSDEGNEGIVENIRSNLKINNPDITGVYNKVIGSYEDLDNKKVYYFVAGTTATGGNSIYQYDTSNETTKLVLQDSLLRFNGDYLITGISIIGEDADRFPQGLLYWTDNFNPPRKINIDKAIRYTDSAGADPLGYQVITYNSLDAIKHPPVKEPTCQNLSVSNVFLTDSDTQNNQLKGKSWQFKYRWVYDDGEISSWSPNSLIHTDNNFDTFFNSGLVSFERNVLPVMFNSGGELVKRIQIATRNTNGMDDWLLVCDVKKSYLKEKIGTSPSSIATLGVGTQLADDSQYVFYFYNDGIYNTVDVLESAKLYNDVPHLAKAQEVVDGNRLVYGNVVTGQTADIEPDISLTPGHGKDTAISDVGTTINLDWELRTQGTYPGNEDTTKWGGKHRPFRTIHSLRFKFEPLSCPDGVAQYNVSFQDMWCASHATQNQSAITGSTRHASGVAICSGSYQSGVFNASQDSPQDIAQSIATDLMSTSFSQWSMEIISGTHISNINTSDTDINNITNWTAQWVSYLENTANPTGPAYLEFQVRSRVGSGYEFRYGGPYFSPYFSGSAGTTGSSWTATTGWNQSMFQWNQLLDDHTPKVRGKASTAFPGSPGCPFPNGSNWNIEAVASPTWIDTPDVTCTGNTNGGVQNVHNDHRAFLGALRIRSLQSGDRILARGEEICPDDATNLVASVSTFKTGARHRFGIVYYDRALRSSSVQLAAQSEAYIPRMAEATTLDPNGWAGEWYIDWEINHAAPDWAEYWQWVYGGNTLTDRYIQFVCAGVYVGRGVMKDIGLNPRDGKSADEGLLADWNKMKGAVVGEDYRENILVDMTPLNDYVLAEGGNPTAYVFEEGDMLRIVSDQNDNPAVNESWEFKILGVVGKGRFPMVDWTNSLSATWNVEGEYKELLVLGLESSLMGMFSTTVDTILSEYTMEIYSPKKKTSEDLQIYNEFGHFGKCVVIDGVNCHMQIGDDISSNAQSQNFTSNIPARGRFTRGDAYYRLRATKSNKLFTNMESFHYTDKYTSDYWDKGRPNAVLEDFRRTRKHSTVLYSEPYVPNTYINGLHSFFADVSFQEFERSYNSIQHLHSKDNALIIFQEVKTSKALVKRDIIYNVDGSGNVATSDTVISQAVPYLGDYGICKHPESFAFHGLRMYFVDVRRGCVLRLSQDGFTVISDNLMKEYFTDKFEEMLSINRELNYNIHGVWDQRFNEYIVSFEEFDSSITTIPDNPILSSLAKSIKNEEISQKNDPSYIKNNYTEIKPQEDGKNINNSYLLDSTSVKKVKQKEEKEEKLRMSRPDDYKKGADKIESSEQETRISSESSSSSASGGY